MKIWIGLGVVAVILVMLFAGLLPLPGQKDNVTPMTQPAPAGTSPPAELPKGPPEQTK